MRSSSSPPTPAGDSLATRAGAWLLLLGIGLIPLFWLPGFHSGFEVPRRVLVLVAMAPVAALLVARGGESGRRARGPVLCALAVMAAGVLPHLGALDVHTAWRSARHWGPLIALVLAGAALARPRYREALQLALILPAVPVLAIGLVRRHLGIPAVLPDRPDVALSSTLGNSNALGEAFAGVFLAALVLAPGMSSRTRRALAWAGCAAALALVLLSSSRGAWLAAACGGAVQLGLSGLARRHDRRLMARTGILALAAAAVLAVWLSIPAGRALRETLRSYVSPTHPTNAVRLATWGATCRMIGDSSPLGVGLGRFEAAFLPYRSAAEWRLSGIDTRVDNPHQEALWIASETGVAGLAAALLLFAMALSRATAGAGDGDPAERAARRALLLASVTLLVLAAFRAPLHHPSGILAFATLLGASAPRKGGARGRRPDFLLVPLVGAIAVLAALDGAEDLRLGRAISSLNAAKGAGGDGDGAALLLESGRHLKSVPHAILKDFDRSFRASLAAGELADVKDGLRVASPGMTFPDLPDQQDVRELLEEVLRLCPMHPGATTQLALLWLKNASVARAVGILEDAVQALPNAPRFRQNLAWIFATSDQLADAHRWMKAELESTPHPAPEDRALLASYALGLGRDEATFGRYLGPTAGAAPIEIAHDAGLSARRRALLLHLLDAPADGLALADLAQTDFALAAQGIAASEVAAEGNRAYARSRVRFAVEALERGDLAQAETYLKLAAQKDHALLDAMILRARVAERDGRAADVLAHLRSALERGVRPEVLRSWLASDPDLRKPLREGRLGELGL